MADLLEQIFPDGMPRSLVLFFRISLAAVVLAFYVTASFHFAYTPDDAYIYFQYARNLALGDGFSFNAGTPSYGVTGPLWAVFLSLGVRAGLDPYVVAKSFDLVFASLGVLLAHLIAFFYTRDRLYALAAAMLVGMDVWILRWSGSGMEASFALFLLLLTLRFAMIKEFPLAAFPAALLCLVRPEGVLALAWLTLQSFMDTRNMPNRWKTLGFVGLFAAIPLVPWIVYALHTFGTVLPNTFGAKTGSILALEDMWTSVSRATSIIATSQGPSIFLLGVSVIALRRKEVRPVVSEFMPVLLPFVLVLGFGVLAANVVSRYLVPFLPLLPIFAVWSLKLLELRFQWSPRSAAVILISLVLTSGALNIFVYQSRVASHLEQFSRGMEECFKPLGYWLKSNTPPNASVIAHDIGMIGYISDRKFYDTPGLITPELRFGRGDLSADDVLRHDSLWRHIQPDYVIERSKSPEELASDLLKPEYTRVFPGLGILSPDTVYFTIYRVMR